MQRYFVNQNVPDTGMVKLPREVAHHFITVMRAKLGSRCELVFNNHHAYLTELANPNSAQVKIIEKLASDPELPLDITIACGLPKTKDKPEIIVQKGTELGAAHFIFFESARSISHWNNNRANKKIVRLQKIAKGAAEQSHRNVIPDVHYVTNLTKLLEQCQVDCRVVAWEESAKEGETSRLARLLLQTSAHQKWLAIFGPEGGLSQAEIEQMKSSGVVPVGLGPRILRAETAPLYFLSAVSFAIELS